MNEHRNFKEAMHYTGATHSNSSDVPIQTPYFRKGTEWLLRTTFRYLSQSVVLLGSKTELRNPEEEPVATRY
jgi:hypothetical protein